MADFSFLPAFVEITPKLITAAQPAPTDFARLRAEGIELVINLAAPGSSSYLPGEAQLVLESGLAYIHLPVVWKAPTLADFETFAAILNANKSLTILVHCAMNMRVSAFVYAYRVKCEGEDESMAWARMERIWTPDEIWTAWLEKVLTA